MNNHIETQCIAEMKPANTFHSFMQKDCYEKFLLELLNKSKAFKGAFKMIKSQSNSESDYFSETFGELEATLLINDTIVKKISFTPQYINSKDFSKWIYKETTNDIIKCVKKKKSKKNVVLFNIFPMRYSRLASEGVYQRFACDDWDIAMNEAILKINNSSLTDSKNIFILSYNQDDTFLLKRLYPQTPDYEFIPFADPLGVFPVRIKDFRLQIKKD